MRIGMISGMAIVLGMLVAGAPQRSSAQDAGAGSTLQVNVSYTGSVTVDEKHKIYVVLWDTPDFATSGGDAMPVEVKGLSDKNGTVTFSDVKKSPAYVSAALDPTGGWDAQSAPPDGSSLGLYSKGGGKPEAIELQPGKTAHITLSFDDSMKMKGGKATR